jgi:hypothetical protein
MNRLPTGQRAEIIQALVEGNSIRPRSARDNASGRGGR